MKALKPILRWAGGKTTKIHKFRPFLPVDFARRLMVDPCVGSGAFLFALHPGRALISDINFQLMNVYETIREYPTQLVEEISCHIQNDTEQHFYEVRQDFNANIKHDVQDTIQAGNLIFLNCRCFNGLYRVNREGRFNVGYYHGSRQPTRMENIIKIIPALSQYLRGHVQITSGDYESILARVNQPAFIILDTPYDGGFTGYDSETWDEDAFHRLRKCVDGLNDQGHEFLLCNSDTALIRALFSEYHQFRHRIPRYINCDKNGRGKVNELVITNYSPFQSLEVCSAK